ncbi:MAG: hypothetical protein QW572_02985 [Candidatus Nitrosocaldus sp.]
MPRQVFSKDALLKLAEGAEECKVVRREDKVKIKVRRARYLYTYVASSSEADDILSKIRIEKVEL